MKRHLAFVAALSLVAVACEEKPANPTPAGGVPAATGDMVAQAKEKAVAAADAVVKEAGTTLDALKGKGAALSGEAKTAFDKTVADLNTMVQDVSAKASSLKSATGESANKLTGEVTTAVNKLTQAVKDAAAKYLK